ncbi:Hpt domain-containing protein [Treponema zioleckii]|uniref:Hpt domain-containing protein n=1 Tax=Treponema zioleckii TaxID=331680 RepID=UPI00168BB84D|nr:Hpt domain-containing protein [Treponema zioleckii]
MEKQILNLTAALELVDGDKELLTILLETFLKESDFNADKVLQFVSANNYIEGAKYVHATKGAGRQICAVQLTTVGQSLEDILRGKATGNIPELAKQMEKEYNVVKEEIKKALQN